MNRILLILCLASLAGSALAANINIGPNGCTLEDAIDSANMNISVGNCAAGSGSDFIIAPDDWVVTLSSDLPTIVSDLTIRSASPAGIFYILGNDQRRVLKITGSNTDVTLQRVQIGGGKTNGTQGAGIRIENATVRLEDSFVVSNRSLNAFCDGIYVTGGDLTLYRSTVQSNDGVGVCATNASVHIVETTFQNNSKINYGVGLSMSGGDLLIERSLFDEVNGISGGQAVVEIVNSTISYSGSNQYLQRSLSFSDFSTVTLNHVTIGFVFRLDESLLAVSNSILNRCDLFSTNVLLDTGNLFHSTSVTLPNCLGIPSINHSILPQADNGGPTKTRAIGNPGSAAINAGNPTYCEALDQRGEARGASCDAGAYEATGYADVSVSARIEPGAPYVSEQHIIVFAEIENKGPGPATNVRFNMNTANALVSRVNSVFCNTNPCVINSIQPGQTMVIPIEVNLFNYFSGSFTLDLSAHTTASSTFADADEDDLAGNNFYSVSHFINQGADLALHMDLLTGDPYFVGQTIQYQARIDNAGPQTATGVNLQFMPENLGSVVFSGCASVSGLNCSVPNIGNGGSRTITIQAQVTGSQFNAVGSVIALPVDINGGNNIDNLNNGGGVSRADLAVIATAIDPAPYYSNQYLRFEIAIGTASEPASNIRLDFDFPGAEYIDVQGCTGFPCVIPQLAANSEVILLAQFFAPVALPGVIDTLNFQVTVTPGQVDPDLSNNDFTVVRPLLPTADIAAQLGLVTPPPYFAGQEVEYSLRVVNAGINTVTGLVASATPQNLTLVSSFGTLCQTLSCTIPWLAAFDEENMTLIYTINNAGAFNLTVTANANEHDSVPGNNTDSTNNGGTAVEPPNSDRIFADGFE